MKAKELFDKAEQTEDVMDRFSTLWQSFNNLYNKINNKNFSEREKIKKFIHLTPRHIQQL